MTAKERFALFQEMIQCVGSIYTWIYDTEGNLCHSSCPEETVFDYAFEHFGCKALLRLHCHEHAPLLLSSPAGLLWGVVFETPPKVSSAYVIGPVCTIDIAPQQLEQFINHDDDTLGKAWKHAFEKTVKNIPTIMLPVFSQYITMLHCCITGQRLTADDIRCYDAKPAGSSGEPPFQRNHQRIYQMEQALLDMIRKGDTNYAQAVKDISEVSFGVPVSSDSPLRQMQDSVMIYVSLCSRAAIEGGLSPDLAYSMGDSYIQAVENCTVVSEISHIAESMYQDFIQCVHRQKHAFSEDISGQIRECCNYIEMHLENNPHIDDIAKRVGYTKYYLSRKFKAEMHISIKDYIQNAKIERAKLLLATTDLPIHEISNRLGYCAPNYMGTVFRNAAGCSPLAYRQKYHVQ